MTPIPGAPRLALLSVIDLLNAHEMVKRTYTKDKNNIREDMVEELTRVGLTKQFSDLKCRR